ncbi:MAG: outer membrane beta-barrel protein [Deltaproteobacteria bacterium]|nr:outer membrane beta-barrel protein [Deltaproteobacteria bacterium]
MKRRDNMIRIFVVFVFLGGLVFTLPELLFADAKFKLKPMFSVSGRYDSNFYLAEENEREVYTFLLEPGVLLGVETPKLKADLTFILEAYFYEDKSDVPEGSTPASDENYVGPLALFDFVYQPVERLKLGLKDDFYITRRPQESDRFSNSIEREKYWINRFQPLIFYDITERITAGVWYRRTNVDYYDSDDDDYIEHRGALDLIYNPTRTVTLDLDYQRWTYDEPDDLENQKYTSDWLRLTAEKRFHYFSFEGGIGFHNRDFDDTTLPDEDLIAYKVAATVQNPPPEEGPRYLGRTYLRSKSHAYLAYERNFNNVGNYFDLYTANRLTASAGHVFAEKFLATIRGYYQKNDYTYWEGLTPEGTTEFREDDITDIQGILEYLITKRMTISVTVGKKIRESNLAGFDYENNYAQLRFNFDYDIGNRGDFSEEASYYR